MHQIIYKKINNDKYRFQITNDGLKYIDENNQEQIVTDTYRISNFLAKMICDDYYYTVNMPNSNNDKFSSGTESDKQIRRLNCNRKEREAHGPIHVYGATMFVNEMLDKLQFNPELTLKDKIITIICTLMHDSCRKGEGKDYWDNDSAILATRLLQHFGMNTEDDKKYLEEIMRYVGNKDGSDGWKINEDDTEKQKKQK